MKNIFLALFGFLICFYQAEAKEVKSFHSKSGTLVVSDDNYSIGFRDNSGNFFSLYDFNDYYESSAYGGERYYISDKLESFSVTGRYAVIERQNYICDGNKVKDTKGQLVCGSLLHDNSYIDFIDMTTGCVISTVSGQEANGYWSKEKDSVWLVNNGDFGLEVANSKTEALEEAGLNNIYLCNKREILNKESGFQTLAKLQSFASLRKNDEALSLVLPLVAFNLAETLSKSNVVFLNDLAFFLEEFNSELDQTSTIVSDRKLTSSIILLERIIKQFPHRTVAYLNLADTYYKEGFEYNNFKSRVKAIENYKTYYDLMQKSNREKKVPSRVLQRIDSSYAPVNSNYTEDEYVLVNRAAERSGVSGIHGSRYIYIKKVIYEIDDLIGFAIVDETVSSRTKYKTITPVLEVNDEHLKIDCSYVLSIKDYEKISSGKYCRGNENASIDNIDEAGNDDSLLSYKTNYLWPESVDFHYGCENALTMQYGEFYILRCQKDRLSIQDNTDKVLIKIISKDYEVLENISGYEFIPSKYEDDKEMLFLFVSLSEDNYNVREFVIHKNSLSE